MDCDVTFHGEFNVTVAPSAVTWQQRRQLMTREPLTATNVHINNEHSLLFTVQSVHNNKAL